MIRLPTTGRLFIRGRIWWCRFRFQNRDYEQSLGTPIKFKAIAEQTSLLEQVRVSMRNGTFAKVFGKGDEMPHPSAQSGDIPLGSMWQLYLDSSKRPQDTLQSTLSQYAMQIDAFLEFIHDRYPNVATMSEVTDEVVRMFFEYLETERNIVAQTKRRYRQLMRRLWHILARKTENPWADFQLPKGAIHKRKRFSVEDVRIILDQANGWIKHAFVLGFYTGQRLVDICMLKWEKVDLSQGEITVKPCKTRNTSQQEVHLWMHPVLVQHLKSLHDEQGNPRNGYVYPELVKKYSHDSSVISSSIRKYLKKLGFEVHKSKSGKGKAIVQFSFHSVRHTCVFLLESNGTPPSVLKQIFGGSYAHYSHGDVKGKKDAIASLPDVGKPIQPIVSTDKPQVTSMSNEEIHSTMLAMMDELHRRNSEKQKAS